MGFTCNYGGFNTKNEANVAAAEVETNLYKGIVPNTRH